MKQRYPDLWQTAVEMRFGTMNSHAYLLRHREGNVLFYQIENVSEIDEIRNLGSVSFQYLSHNHEILPTLENSRERIGAKLCGHSKMAPYFNNAAGLDVEFETSDTEIHAGGLEVIFTPGHTDNNTCYRYKSPHGKTYLFTGDTIWQDHGEWRTLIFSQHGGNAHDLKQTLLRLRRLDVDILICSVSVGKTQIVEVNKSEWEEIIDGLVEELP